MTISITGWSLIFGATYIAIVSFIALSAFSRSREVDDFTIAGRRVGAALTAISMTAGMRDGAGIAAWVAFTYYFGFGALWLYAGALLGLLLILYTKRGLRDYCESKGHISVTEFLRDHYGPSVEVSSVAIYILTGLLIVAAQLFVAGQIVSSLLNISANLSLIVISSVIAIYLTAGGYLSVTWTDGFQWLIFLALLVFLSFVPPQFDSVDLIDQIAAVPFQTAVPLMLLVASILYSSGDIWQRVISASSDRTASKGIIVGSLIYGLISISIVLLGFSIKSTFPDSNPSSAFIDAFASGLQPAFVGPLLAMFVVAAIMSTIDTQIFLISSSASATYRRLRKNRAVSRRQLGGLMLGFLTFSTVAASMIGDLVVFLFGSYSLGGILAPIIALALLCGNRHKPNRRLALIGVLFALGAYVWLFFENDSGDLSLNLIPIGIAATFASLSWAWRQPESTV